MADGPTDDKDFQAASPEDQHAYLMATDKDYAKASPEDQKAYLGHIRGTASSIPGAPSGLPGMPKPANPILGENTVSQHRMIPGPGGGFHQDWEMPEKDVEQGQNLVNAGLGLAGTGLGLAVAPAATIGAIGGGYLAGKGAKYGTKALGGGETAQDIAETGGDLA